VNIEILAETNFHRGVRAAETRDLGGRFRVFALARDQCREGVPEGIRRKTPGEFGFLPGRKGYHQIPSAKNNGGGYGPALPSFRRFMAGKVTPRPATGFHESDSRVRDAHGAIGKCLAGSSMLMSFPVQGGPE